MTFEYAHRASGVKIEVSGVMTQVSEDVFHALQGIAVSAEDLNASVGSSFFVLPEIFLQDRGVVGSARVSTGRDRNLEGGSGLIGALYRDIHETPFEGGSIFRLRVETPICFAPYFFQLPLVHNEFSGRYSVIDGDLFRPQRNLSFEEQGLLEESEKKSLELYNQLLSLKIAKEQARFAMPFSFVTKFYWTISLRHLLELLALESHSNAPIEFWEAIHDIVPKILEVFAPVTYAKMKEFPRVIKTAWHADLLDQSQRVLEADLLQSAQDHRDIGNIGTLHLLYAEPDDSTFFRLATQTKINPARGFAHVSMRFFLKIPIFVHRQWVRHRNGVWTELPYDFDEIVARRDFYIPRQFRVQVGKSMAYIYEPADSSVNQYAQHLLRQHIEQACDSYYQLREKHGWSASEASIVLPYIFRVKDIWTVGLESLMNYLSLRCDGHAQQETRECAECIYQWFRERYAIPHQIFLEQLNFGKNPALFGR